ncbi:uncharacterized protein LOC113337408 [Papaver somniferum]|uniref:uncharacterized protein LOC113337408 n=1 Tax=Papaver somniferum TaxID=3469 RepID=UPI000E6FC56F|nr:uncharacterized protein LOC113337408 [Papaver somniferum]
MNDFRSFISDNGLVEAVSLGKKFTWSNGQQGTRRIVSKHDRALVNNAWLQKFEKWRCKSLPSICSDHSPLLGFSFQSLRPARAPFRFHTIWKSHPTFMLMVEERWKGQLVGAPPFIFTNKLKRLKETMKVWNRKVFGDIHFRLKQAELKLEGEMDLLDLDPADENQFIRVVDAKKVADDVRRNLAIMVRLKSRVTWLEEGDQNTKWEHPSLKPGYYAVLK